ncbi:enolase 4 isoform X2 [Silurus meridionalis]|nr:enolase 4 isoform X2 [Silurus meridionalis]
MVRYLEDQDAREKEQKREEEEKNEQTSDTATSPPPPASGKDKKKGEKGKKGSAREKPLPPPEKPEPVLPGAMADLTVLMPRLLVSMISCGKDSAGKLNLLEEVILLPSVPHKAGEIIEISRDIQREIRRIVATTTGKSGPTVTGVSEGGAIQLGVERAEQALDLLMEACLNLGLPIGTELRLAINCAAHLLFDYDVEQWQKLSSLTGQSCCLIADAAFRPCPHWKKAKPLPPGVTWVTLRHRSEMTLTDLLHSVTERTEGETILAVNSDEIGDDSMIDVAVGLGVTFIKLGGLTGGGRMNKYNRLHKIEQELEEQGILGIREVELPCESSPEEEETQTQPET